MYTMICLDGLLRFSQLNYWNAVAASSDFGATAGRSAMGCSSSKPRPVACWDTRGTCCSYHVHNVLLYMYTCVYIYIYRERER